MQFVVIENRRKPGEIEGRRMSTQIMRSTYDPG